MAKDATFTIDGEVFLLAPVGSNYHAVRPADTSPHMVHTDWESRTVCGRVWVSPGDPDGDPFLGWGPAISPSCRGCLRNVTKGLIETPEDDRLPRLASEMVASVIDHGSAQCSGVPGDQAERLRARIRDLLAGKTQKLVTLHRDGLVVAIDERDRDDAALQAAMAAALNALLADRNVGTPSAHPWSFDWLDF